MGYGIKFRLSSCLSVKQTLQQNTCGIDWFIYKLVIYYNESIEFFEQWKCLILNRIKVQLNNASSCII